ncbi:hypothetical protein FRC03_004763 [Tulasnella sp. 419]|nr:hypothetical protein FRC03_004763 [Tulasnella sp. 419]
MAFKLVNDHLSPATVNAYMSLMRFSERFLLRSMSASQENGEDKNRWRIMTVRMIPSVMRVFQHADSTNRAEAAKTALRIIARILPDDWKAEALGNVEPVSELRYITSQDQEFGPIAVSLMSSFLEIPTLHISRATRDAAAEVLGWMMTLHQPQVHSSLPSIITDPAGMFQQSTSIPPFLLSVLRDDEADKSLPQFLQSQFYFMTNLPSADDGSMSAVQLEALTFSLTHLSAFPEPPRLAHELRDFWDRTAERCEEILWPDSFVDAGIVTAHSRTTGQHQVVRALTDDEQILVKNDGTCRLWTGTAIALI